MTGSLLAVYCILIVAASVSGGWLPTFIRMTHLRTQLLMSFVAGLMLGIAMLHMLAHAVHLIGSPRATCAASLTGVIAMFLLLRAFHTHAHGHGHTELDGHADSHQQSSPTDDHARDHDHHHGDDCDHDHSALPIADASDELPGVCNRDHGKDLSWLGMLFGLGLHTLMDGVALAASVAAEATHNPWLGLAGLGTFLAVALHKPLDAFAITSVMKNGGWTPGQQSFVNMAFSLACPIGAILVYVGATQWSTDGAFLGWGLALSAGFFICISLSDLLPEVAFHHHDRLKLTIALLLGVGLAVGIESLPGHKHHDSRDQVGDLQMEVNRLNARVQELEQ